MHTLAELFNREDANTEDRRRLWQHQMAVYGIRLNEVLGSNPDALRHWAGYLTERPLETDAATPRAVAVRARHAAAQGRWPEAAALFESMISQAPRMDVMGQAVELQLRTAHALLQCGRVVDAAQAAAPAIDRMLVAGERGHALMCGPRVLSALADALWGRALTMPQQAELREAARLAASLRETLQADHPPAGPGRAAATSTEDTSMLSSREREVLERIAAGDSNKVIARVLDISPHTVKRHVANILDKLGLASRGQASAWLRENA
jgi:LuxR family maltose regulon positive regulatory protein